MDASSLMKLLINGKNVGDQGDNNAVIRQWLKADRIPDPYQFRPTMEAPICRAPGRASAEFRQAYAVLSTGTGMTGNGLATWCDWDWFLDEAAARREAYCRIWQQTETGQAWLDRSGLEHPTFADLRRCEQREIQVPGGSLVLYRVPALDSFFGSIYLWKVVVEKDCAITIQRETLFKAWSMTKGVLMLSDPGNDPKSQNVPAVYSQQLDECPWTGEPITGYASWALTERCGIIRRWFPVKEEATIARTRVYEWLCAREQIRREREELADSQALYHDACHALRKQEDRKEYRNFGDQLLVSSACQQDDDGDDVGEQEKTVDWYLEQTDKVEAKAAAIARALDTEREFRLAPWKGGSLELLRTTLVAAMPVCPLCGKQYVTDDVLEDLVVFNEVDLRCCGVHGLSADPKRLADGQTVVPDIVARLNRSAERARNCNDETGRGILFEPMPIFSHFVIELGRVMVGEKMVARFLVRWRSMCRWEVVILSGYNLQTVMQEAGGPPKSCSFEDTFPRREKLLGEWWRKRLDASVAEGRAVWLQLEWRGERHGWGASRQKSGTKTVYKVDRPTDDGYDPSTTYFCRIISTPSHVQRSDFVLHIVQPDLEASE